MKSLRSNVRLIVFVAGLALISSTWADHANRDFTSTNGCTIKGKLLDFDMEKQIATILREGMTDPSHASIAVFCDTDRQYIRDWAFERDFRESLKISVRLIDVARHEEIKDKRYDPKFVKCQAYEVEMKNRSDTEFLSAEVEYCVFYKQIERNGTTCIGQNGVLCDRIEVGTMAPDSCQDLKTQSITLYDEGGHTTSLFGSDGGSYGEVEGIWLRVTATLTSGEQVVRNICFPDNLSSCRDWTTTTVSAGLNRKSHRSITLRSRLAPVELPPVIRLTLN